MVDHKRYETLRQSRVDTRLPYGARNLYAELDDRAGNDDTIWVKQETYAAQFKTSQSRIAEWMGKLRVAGYIRTQRRQKEASLCTLVRRSGKSLTPAIPDISKRDISKRDIGDVQISQNEDVRSVASLYDPQTTSTTEELESRSVVSTTVTERPTTDRPPFFQNHNHKTPQRGISVVSSPRKEKQHMTHSVSSTVVAELPPSPTDDEPKTPEARYLKGLRNRRAGVEKEGIDEGIWKGGILEERPGQIDADLVSRLIATLGHVPEWFFWDVLDAKIREKVQRRQPYFAKWLVTAARDAVKLWEAMYEVPRKPPQTAPIDAVAVGLVAVLASQARVMR